MIGLSQMTRTTLAISELKKNNLPYIVVLTDPTTGGQAASFGMLGDIHYAEPGAIVAFAGSRVIKATVNEELPIGFQKSEYVQKTGFIDIVTERKNLPKEIGSLLSILLNKNSGISSEISDEITENTEPFRKEAS
jgi:acetyl-CoA carboxylase carboxyl transferase subunit beta